MKPKQLFVRCFADMRDGQWQAFCLDLDLAVQGDTLPDVKHKLEKQIEEYIFDALAGEDQAHAYELMSRRAPPSLWFRYYWYGLLLKVLTINNGVRRFKECIPLVPAHHSMA